MSSYIDYAQRRGQDISCDDLRENFWGWYPSEVRNPVASDIRKVARDQGFRMEIYYCPWDCKYYMFGVNSKGFRWQFLSTDQLDSTALFMVKQIIWGHNKMSAPRRVRKMHLDRKNREQGNREREMEELVYLSSQYRRIWQGMSRFLGHSAGDIRMPWGASNNERSLKKVTKNAL